MKDILMGISICLIVFKVKEVFVRRSPGTGVFDDFHPSIQGLFNLNRELSGLNRNLRFQTIINRLLVPENGPVQSFSC
jgi:hypothetical protein